MKCQPLLASRCDVEGRTRKLTCRNRSLNESVRVPLSRPGRTATTGLAPAVLDPAADVLHRDEGLAHVQEVQGAAHDTQADAVAEQQAQHGRAGGELACDAVDARDDLRLGLLGARGLEGVRVEDGADGVEDGARDVVDGPEVELELELGLN